VAFSESFLQELCERNDIVDVVSGYVRLTKKSGSNQFGLCPFHSEKTPSFSVSADKQIFHCFGCGKGGGVINFIMEIENLSFPEAVEFLAKRANMPMPEQENSAESRKRERMFALNRDAARYFYEQLKAPGSDAALAYMQKRRISPATAVKFGLGYAPDGWDNLRSAMRAKGYTDQELFDAGLVRRGKSGGFYDTFRSRLMFPVIDVRGNVVAFSGRVLGDGEPKYMNSPETIVFSKSHNLFGLNLAKKSKCGYIILCEGNIDVVSMHQAGFDSAVASLGTSLTPEQARLMSRYKNEVVIAYDNDGAGQKAAQRAIGIMEKLDMKVRVLRMSGAKDPDEFIKANGADAFRNLLDKSENQVDYRLKSITDKYDLTADDQKVAFLKEATDLVARLPGSVERQVYSMRVSAMTGVTADAIIAEAERRRKKLVARAQQDTEKAMHPEKEFQPRKKELKYEDTLSAAAEEGVIRLLFLDQGLFAGGRGPAAEDFSSPELRGIYQALLKRAESGGSMNMAALGDALTPEQTELLAGLLQKPEVLSNAERSLGDYIEKIKMQKMLREGKNDLMAQRNKYLETKGCGD
jgi:DNA primase